MHTDGMDHGYRGGLFVGDRYRLLRSLGEGAMGWVWLAWHETLDVPVAVKISKRESEAGARREAHLTASLRHPAIVSVLDSGRTPLGHSYFVMEHLEGRSLAAVLECDGRLSVRAAVSLLLPVLDALEHCHARGVVHRDLKPDNVFLSRAGNRTLAKLLDFGVAGSGAAETAQPELIGTPGYMAPEQGRCEPVIDHRADLWAFCAILYEAVAGEPAIRGESCSALLLASTEPQITPLSDRSRDAARLWPILRRGLRARPHERFQSAAELRAALRAFELDGDAVSAADRAPPAPRPRRHVQRGLAPALLAAAQTIVVTALSAIE